MILQRIKTRNDSPVAFIMDKGNGVQCIQKLNGSVLGWGTEKAETLWIFVLFLKTCCSKLSNLLRF